MKNIVLLFLLAFNYLCYSQTEVNAKSSKLIKMLSPEKTFIFITNNKETITNIDLRGKIFQTNTVYPAKYNKGGCMWCFLAPVAAGIFYYQSYVSFKDDNKTDGYVALGLASGFTVFSVIYFFPTKHKNR